MVTSEEFKKMVDAYMLLVIKPLYCSKRVFDNEYNNFKFEHNFSYLGAMDPFDSKVTFYLTEYFVASSHEVSRQEIASVKVSDIEWWYNYDYLPLLEQLEENLKKGPFSRR